MSYSILKRIRKRRISPSFSAHEHEIAIEKAKRNGFGRVLLYNFFKGSLIYSGSECQIVGYVEGSELYWLSIIKGEKADVLMDEGEIRDWMTSILEEWLQNKQQVQFNWSRQEKPEGENESYLLQVFTEVSEITVDASLEEEPQVFRWSNEGYATQCKTSTPLPEDEVEDIIKKSGLEIPADAELVEISPFGEDTDTPYLMVRYSHILADKDFNERVTVPPLYQNPGKIIVEGDLYTIGIDPENKRVISEFRKWHPIKGT